MKRTFSLIACLSMPPAFFSGCMQRPIDHSFGRWDHMMGYGGYGMMFLWLVLVIAVGVIVYALVSRRGNGITLSRDERETPLEILKNRYARGEITKEEFDRMKDDIESS